MWIVCAVRPTKSGNYIFEDCGQRKLYRIHAAGYHPVEKALMILETAETKREFRDRMKQELFPDGCSQNCYY